MTDNCALCLRAAALDATGEWTWRGDEWAIAPHPGLAAPGWFALQTVTHVEGLLNLSSSQADQLGPLLVTATGALARACGGGPIYAYSIGTGSPHVHILFGPPGMGRIGKDYLIGLLSRDPTLADAAGSDEIAARFRDELASVLSKIAQPDPTR
jgi:hypothetical protein